MWPFRWPTHTAASSHLFSLTWHVKTLLKAPWHPPALAHLSLDNTWRTKTHLFAYMCYDTIKPHKAIFNILPILSATCFSDSSSLFPHPLRCFISLLSSTESHAYTLSGSISSDWIDGPQAFCWLRRCQIWWVIGKLCLAATLSGMAIHFVNPDLWLLSLQYHPACLCDLTVLAETEQVSLDVINASQWVHS